MAPSPLPIDTHLPEIRGALARHRAVVVVAAPGSGKTTRIPPAIADAGRVVVLQPRRVAARAVARRIADEQGWTPGVEVGWHVRFERRATSATRVLLVTEGMLTRYLDDDPLLSDVTTVVLDEFHERSIHTDLGLALVAEAWRARPDLRIVVMSATMDARPVQSFLDNCPVVEATGLPHPLESTYVPTATIASVLPTVLADTTGDILCFLPGARDIDGTRTAIRHLANEYTFDVLPLHGGLDSEAQDTALRGGPRRRVILATNIAETSLTVPGVQAVIDTGWHKVARYDAERAIDHLVLRSEEHTSELQSH